MLAFADMMNLFSHELARLRRGLLPSTLLVHRPFQRIFFGHTRSPQKI
jgi:hypothetical protein